MRNQIGTGTCTIGVNIPKDERDLLGQLANSANESISQLVRRMMLIGLEAKNPAAAKRLKEIRVRYYAGFCLALIFAGTVTQWLDVADDDAARRVRTVRGLKANRWSGRLEMEEV